MQTLEDTPARLRLLRPGTYGFLIAASLGPLALGAILAGAAIASGLLLFAAFAGPLLLIGLCFLAILLIGTPEHELTFNRTAGTLTIRARGPLRARSETLPLSQLTGIALERAARRMRQDDPQTGKRRTVTDIAFRPVLLTGDTRRPMTPTFTNQPTATAPARTALRWLLQDATAEPPVLDQPVDLATPRA